MKRYFGISLILLITLFTGLPSTTLMGQTYSESILVEQSVSEDLYLAGRNIDVIANVDSDIVAAGRRVTISGLVNGDVILAGENLTIDGTVQDDVRIAGRSINLTGDIYGHIVAAGQSILIGMDAEIGDWAWLAGESVMITGTVNGEVKAAGRMILIDSEVHGDMELIGQELHIGPRGKIHGDLIWRSPSPLDISDDAQIDGQTIEKQFPQDWDGEKGIGSFLFTVLSLTTAGFVLFLLLPTFCNGAASLIRTVPWKCFAVGIATLLIIPFVSLFLIMTAIGYLLGLVLLMVYLASLIIAWLVAMVSMGEIGLRITGKYEAANNMTWLIAILSATIIIVLFGQIPYLGGLLFLLLLIYGLGCINIGLFRSYSITRLV